MKPLLRYRSQPRMISGELQTNPHHPHPPGEAEFRVSPGALRIETGNQNL